MESSLETKMSVTRTNVAVVAAFVTLLGAAGLSGGFRAAKPETMVVAELSATQEGIQPVRLRASPLSIEVYRSYVVDGARIVEMDVTNESSISMRASRFTQGIDLMHSNRGKGEQPRVSKHLYRRESTAPLTEVPLGISPVLNPGVSIEAILVLTDQLDFENQAYNVADADTLRFWSREYRKTPLDGSVGWWKGDVVGELILK